MYYKKYSLTFLLLSSLGLTANFFSDAFVVKPSLSSSSSSDLNLKKIFAQNEMMAKTSTVVSLKANTDDDDDDDNDSVMLKKDAVNDLHSNISKAMGIFATSAVIQLSQLQPTQALEQSNNNILPKTALIIETSQIQLNNSNNNNEAVLKTKVDGKALVKSLITNRKELNSSVKRIVDFTSTELKNGPWLEIGKELLAIEGDVVPEVRVKLPTDWQGALKDLTSGRFDVVVNGEILYVDVKEMKGDNPGDDEITIRIRGTKASLPEFEPSATSTAATAALTGTTTEQINPGSDFWEFWNAPLPVTTQVLPSGYVATNGQTIIGGTAVAIIASYAASYQYYMNEIAREEAEAAEKRLKKKKNAELKKEKKEEEKKKLLVEVENMAKEGDDDKAGDVKKDVDESKNDSPSNASKIKVGSDTIAAAAQDLVSKEDAVSSNNKNDDTKETENVVVVEEDKKESLQKDQDSSKPTVAEKYESLTTEEPKTNKNDNDGKGKKRRFLRRLFLGEK